MRAAQVQARGLVCSRAPSGAGASAAVGSGSTRPYATTRARQRARGANTPWQISRLVSGRGVIAAKRSRNSSGSKTSSLVLSYHALLSSNATRPSPRSRRRSCAKGGRKTYLQRRSTPARSCADTHTLACRSNPSRRACRGPRDVTAAVPRASPSRRRATALSRGRFAPACPDAGHRHRAGSPRRAGILPTGPARAAARRGIELTIAKAGAAVDVCPAVA